jgi:hypothetical protein
VKQSLQRVTLTCNHWHGPIPPMPGDWLRTSTGRTYEVVEVRGKRLICRVLPWGSQQPFGVTLYHWEWSKRIRKRAG